ncbi:50S ribosomal protein L28 [Lentzea sp. NPDC055074]
MRCQLTGREPGFGNRVSHSQRKTRRRWNPNVQAKRYFVPSLNRFVTLTLSAKGIKTIDKIGVEAAVARLRRQGVKV